MPVWPHFQVVTLAYKFSPLFLSSLFAFTMSYWAPNRCQSLAYNVQGTVSNGGMHRRNELTEIFVFRGMIWDNERKQGLQIKNLRTRDLIPSCHLQAALSMNHSDKRYLIYKTSLRRKIPQPPGWKFLHYWHNLALCIWLAFWLLAFVYLFFSCHGKWSPSGYHSWGDRPVWHIAVTCNNIFCLHPLLVY